MISIQQVKEDAEVKAIMYIAESQIEALGFTEHSVRHSSIVSKWAGEILEALESDPWRIEMARIAANGIPLRKHTCPMLPDSISQARAPKVSAIQRSFWESAMN